MRYVLKLESIGEHAVANAKRRWIRGTHRVTNRDQFLIENARKLRPWVARIEGFDGQYGLARDFITGNKDYAAASGKGNWGVFLYYWLAPGIYEVNQRMSVKCARRYFLQVRDHETAEEITKEQVEKWLQENHPLENP